jgi:hypothetical protein
MMPPDALTARLAALERSHRRLRALVAILALALAAAALLGAGDDGVLSGRTLKLLDEKGRLRVLLTTNTGLSFLDDAGRPRAMVGLDAAGTPGLVLNGDASRAILNVNHDGPALTLMGDRGGLRAILALVRGEPGLVFFDAQEQERARLAVDAGSGRGVLRDAEGGTTWQVPRQD